MTSRNRRNQPTRAAWTWGLGSAAVILILAAAISVGFFTGTEKPVDLLIDFHQYHYGAVPEEFDYDATVPAVCFPEKHPPNTLLFSHHRFPRTTSLSGNSGSDYPRGDYSAAVSWQPCRFGQVSQQRKWNNSSLI